MRPSAASRAACLATSAKRASSWIRWSAGRMISGSSGAALLLEQAAGGGDGGRRVAADRLEQQLHVCRRLVTELGELLDRLEGVLAVGDDQAGVGAQPLGAQCRALEQRWTAADPHERLGHGFPRNGPQPGAGSAAQNDRQHASVYSSGQRRPVALRRQARRSIQSASAGILSMQVLGWCHWPAAASLDVESAVVPCRGRHRVARLPSRAHLSRTHP